MNEPTAEPAPTGPAASGPRVVITYCTQCRWLLRASWLAGELLTSFTTELGEVALRPGVGGVFTVAIDDELVWDRKRDGGFPELAPLKRLVRDRVAPGRSLGHTDRHVGSGAGPVPGPADETPAHITAEAPAGTPSTTDATG